MEDEVLEKCVCDKCKTQYFYSEKVGVYYSSDTLKAVSGGSWCHGKHKEPVFLCEKHVSFLFNPSVAQDLPLSWCETCALKLLETGYKLYEL